jgi:hypothetical protein
MIADAYKFERDLPSATAAEVALLQDDGYRIHKEWMNGIELRKGKPFREWLLALHIAAILFFPILLLPGFMRGAVNNLFGYKYRVFVTLDLNEPDVFFV